MTTGGCCSYVTGGFNSNSDSSLKIKIDGSATGNRVELDYDYTGLSTYHHVDIDIDGGSNAVYFDDGDADHSNTSLGDRHRRKFQYYLCYNGWHTTDCQDIHRR